MVRTAARLWVLWHRYSMHTCVGGVCDFALLFGARSSKMPHLADQERGAIITTCRNDFQESIRYLLKNASLVMILLTQAV